MQAVQDTFHLLTFETKPLTSIIIYHHHDASALIDVCRQHSELILILSQRKTIIHQRPATHFQSRGLSYRIFSLKAYARYLDQGPGES